MVMNLLKRIPGAKKLAKFFGVTSSPKNHREFLLNLLPKESICAEIGVHKGDFSAQILRSTHPRELHLIDPWKYEDSDTYKNALYGGKTQGGQVEMNRRYEAVCQRFHSEVDSGRVMIHRAYSSEALNKFPDSYFDWIYIDGNHLYEYVKQDLELSFKKIKPGGFITGDDYQQEGWWQGGVMKAVDEFAREKPVEVIAIRESQFVLRK